MRSVNSALTELRSVADALLAAVEAGDVEDAMRLAISRDERVRSVAPALPDALRSELLADDRALIRAVGDAIERRRDDINALRRGRAAVDAYARSSG